MASGPSGGGGQDKTPREAFEAAVGLGLALVALFTAPLWVCIIGVGLVAGWYWFVRGRRGWLVPAACVTLLAGGMVWRLADRSIERSSEGVLTEQTDRLAAQADKIDAEIERLQGIPTPTVAQPTPTTSSVTPSTTSPPATRSTSTTVAAPLDAFAPLRSSILAYVNQVRADQGAVPLQVYTDLVPEADRIAARDAAGLDRRDPERLASVERYVPRTWVAYATTNGHGNDWTAIVAEMADKDPSYVVYLQDARYEAFTVGLAFSRSGELYVVLFVFDIGPWPIESVPSSTLA